MAGTVGFQSLIRGYLAASLTAEPLVPPSHPFEKVTLEVRGEQITALLARDGDQAAFFRQLGFNPDDPDRLRQALVTQAHNHPCLQVEGSGHDLRFVIRGPIKGPKGAADIDSVWVMGKYASPPTARLDTIHPLQHASSGAP